MSDQYKISISIQKRVLLHLAEYINSKDAFEVDYAISQPGIAEAIGIRLEHVSRSLKKLLDSGEIECRSAHIKGIFRRKRIYNLTQKGHAHVEEIKRWFNEKLIVVRDFDGEIKEIKLNLYNNS